MDLALIDYLTALYVTKGSRAYGEESVSQLEHALQCALVAEEEGASDALVAASLLHDVGHLVHETEAAQGARVDDRHEYRPIRMLRRQFGDAVLAPIRLHVAAKRYLCTVDPAYWHSLSAASRCSLALQGGVYSPEAAQRFIKQPYATDAVRLRTWDDRAKVAGKATPPLSHYVDVLMRCAHESADTQSAT